MESNWRFHEWFLIFNTLLFFGTIPSQLIKLSKKVKLEWHENVGNDPRLVLVWGNKLSDLYFSLLSICVSGVVWCGVESYWRTDCPAWLSHIENCQHLVCLLTQRHPVSEEMLKTLPWSCWASKYCKEIQLWFRLGYEIKRLCWIFQ